MIFQSNSDFINEKKTIREGVKKKLWLGGWGWQGSNFFFLASKWSETSRNAKKFFFICEGGGGRVGGFASSEDQIGGNILSIFKFSRGKNQSCLKGAETSRNGIKKNKYSTFGSGFYAVTMKCLCNQVTTDDCRTRPV